MTEFVSEKDRNVIPRWRSFRRTQTLDELHSSLPPPLPPESVEDDPLAQKVADWKKFQTVGHASDIIGAAFVEEKLSEATDAIEFLLDETVSAAPLAKKLAARSKELLDGAENLISTPPSQKELQIQVSRLRHLLHEEPKNPIQWVDLSRAYASLGQYKQSSHCMNLAVNLAPNNRFVLRCAARLWVHTDQKDKAYYVLVRSDRTPHDPWLISAEIAVGIAAEKKLRFVKRAQQILASDRFLRSHVSELASAVATLEWKNGAERNSRKLFRQSLIEPTENSIAQAVWISGKDNVINLEFNPLHRPDAHEAQARSNFFKEKWHQAIFKCKEWQKDEPFSKRPAILGSYIASVVLEEFSEAKQFALSALDSNPNDPNLLNSLAYSLINLGEHEEANIELSKIPATNNIEHMVLKSATTGLLRYREDNVQEGRTLYNQALSLADKITKDNPSLPAKVAAFHAFEEFHHQPTPDRHQLIATTIQNLKKHNDPFCQILTKKLVALRDSNPSLVA